MSCIHPEPLKYDYYSIFVLNLADLRLSRFHHLDKVSQHKSVEHTMEMVDSW
jgi:hypothetical protein